RQMRFTEEALAALGAHCWPGNVRELRNLIDRIAVFSDENPVGAATVNAYLEAEAPRATEPGLRALARAVLQTPAANNLEAIEEALLTEAMALAGGNKSAAARLLGISRKAVERRLARDDGAAPAEEEP